MRQFTCLKAVTYPSTNRARCRATALIETNALPLHQTANHKCSCGWRFGVAKQIQSSPETALKVAVGQLPIPVVAAFIINKQLRVADGVTCKHQTVRDFAKTLLRDSDG